MTAALRPSVPSSIETKLNPVALASIAIDGTFEGYASIFNRQDLGRDVVLPGAFRASLATRGAAGIRMLYQHDPGHPLGTWLRLYEDARGLFVRGRLALESAKAREVHALMRAGAIDGLSIGFRAVRGQRDRKTGVRRLEAVDLWEISIVTFPMLPEARVASVKSACVVSRLHPAARGGTRLRGIRGRYDLPPDTKASLIESIEQAARLIRNP